MENIIQLRNYHINKGKDNDKTPLYPITTLEAVKGAEKLSGVTKVTSLPTTPEPGKIYYNTETGDYYVGIAGGIAETVVTNGNYVDTVPKHWTIEQPIPHVITGSDTVEQGGYDIKPYTYYKTGFELENVNTLKIYPLNYNESTYTNEYCFIFTPSSASISITIVGVVITVPDSAQEILENLEANHTYEFNIFGGVLLVTDITAS